MDVRILGSLEATVNGRTVDLGLRQARVLVAALALQPNTPVHNARLAEALWPAGPPARWEATVQSHVSRLRRALEPDRPPRTPSRRIRTHGDAYSLQVAEDELDSLRFERLATEGRAALAREDHARADELLGRALHEWRGPVLADLGDPSILGPAVVRLEEMRLLAAEECAEAAIALGEHRRAVLELETLIAADPLRERSWELLLLSLYRSGRQSEALRRYREVRTLLVEELGVEPGPALSAIEGAILRQAEELAPKPELATAAAVTVDVAPPVWLQAPADTFVGRGDELASIRRAYESAVGGDRRFALVEGEPGIGKTRLLREACRDLRDRGVLVVGGRCAEEPLHVLEPFAEAVERVALAQSDRLARDAPGDVAALAGLVPELSRHAPPPPAADADAHRYMLFRAVSKLLDSGVRERPVVLVLDDLHWAAGPALRLLSHVVRDDDRGSLLVLGAARDTEPNPGLAALLADLNSERRLDRIKLAGLGPDEVRTLASARGADVAAANLFSMTEGNPFYVEELVRHVAESGGVLDAGTLPDSVRDTIARRLLRLPENVRRILGFAAVAVGEFRLDVVALAAGVGIEEADDALAVAVRAGAVRELPARAGAYRFAHALIRAVLREALGAARRARAHRRLGEVLADLGGGESEVAHHLLAAAEDNSDVGPGVYASLGAAATAVQRFAYDDAVTVLQTAWDTLGSQTSPDAHLVCRVAVALADALRRSGTYEERATLLEDAWRHAAVTGDAELAAEVVIEGCAGTVDPAAAWITRAEATVDRLDETSPRRVLLTALLSYAWSSEPGDRARRMAEWALARAPALEPSERRAVMEFAFLAVLASSPIERVVDLARTGLAAARVGGSVFELIEALSVVRIAYLASGDIAASDEVAREYEDRVRMVRAPRFMAGVEQRRGMRALLAGRFVEAEAHGAEAVSLQPLPEFVEGYAAQIFALRLEQGRLGEVRDAVESFAAADQRPAWTIGYSTLLAELGELDAAAEVLRPFVESGFDNVSHDELFFLGLTVAANTAVRVGDRDAALVLYDLLAPHGSRVVVAAQGALCWGSIQRFLGPLSALLGDSERASMHFEAAMSVHERLGARPFLARDRLAYADLLGSVGGDPVRIGELTRTGLALASQLGMNAVLERHARLGGDAAPLAETVASAVLER
ncbi:MAG: BTAD domain-containing putative transcriptional regulator [Acidimicrobiia bacterium]